MCRRSRHSTYPRPDRRTAPASGKSESPDPVKYRYEALCALCGLGLAYRVRCANVGLLGLVEPEPLVEGMEMPVWRGNDWSMTSGWSRHGIGIEVDPTCRTICETRHVRVPYIPYPRLGSQTVYGNYIESTIGNAICARRFTRNFTPIPLEFWDTSTTLPMTGPFTASAADAAAPAPARGQSPDILTYIIHNRCHEILKLLWARENKSWDRREGAGASTSGTDTNTITTAMATNDNLNPNYFLPALFIALHNLGRTPGTNYWSKRGCEFNSESDFPGLAESMTAYCNRPVDGPEGTDFEVMPHLGIVCSRNMWPHLNPHNDQDEFCPRMDYTGTALVAVADPTKEIAYLRELLPPSPTSNINGSISITIGISPPGYSTLPPPSQSAPITRIAPYGPSTATDPFAYLPPELLLQILNYLSLPHIASLRLSSRALASFIHPTIELPTSYFRNAFCSGGEFEFLQGLSVLTPASGFDPEGSVVPRGREEQGVDWRGLYRKVQYLLEANSGLEAAARKLTQEPNNLAGGKSLEQKFECVVVPRSPGLANRRRIWAIAGRVAREMKRVMGECSARQQREQGAGVGEREGADRGVEVGLYSSAYSTTGI